MLLPNKSGRRLRVSVIGTRGIGTESLLLALACAAVACKGPRSGAADATTPPDSAFAAMQSRGEMVMGVNQYTSAHVFEDLPDGGRIVLDRDTSTDTAGIVRIRRHMRDIAAAFEAADFTKPFQVHATAVPGTSVMAARQGAITYQEMDRPRGAEVRIRTTDRAAVTAVHEILAFQRGAHHAQGHEGAMGHVP